MKWLQRIPSRVDRVIVVTMIGVGLLVPWVVAVGVKLYLQSLGRPTWPWSDIAAYAMFFGPWATPIAAAPLILLAVYYRKWTVAELRFSPRATPLQARLVVLFAFGGGVAGMARAFIDAFWEFDPLVLWLIPEIVVLCLPWMAGGFVLGALVAAIAGAVARRSPGGRRERDAGAGGGGFGRAPRAGISSAADSDRSRTSRG